MLIKLSDGCWVAAEEIGQITVSTNQVVTVRMKNGVGHPIDNDRGSGSHKTAERLVREINAAKELMYGPK